MGESVGWRTTVRELIGEDFEPVTVIDGEHRSLASSMGLDTTGKQGPVDDQATR
jgi:hypothetical protein